MEFSRLQLCALHLGWAKRKGAADGFLTVTIEVFYSHDNKGDRINGIYVTPQVALVPAVQLLSRSSARSRPPRTFLSNIS
jgi:hypothetical protein